MKAQLSRLGDILVRSPLLSIALFISAANWQLLFGLRYIKWDSENYWHPWRHFIAQCYNNGIVPLWNPYTQAGYPVHGDLQGPAYSIDAILTSFLFKGSVYSINLIFLAYLIFGAYGFYKLSRFILDNSSIRKSSNTITTTQVASLLAGIIYSISGYVTAHGHNLYIVISIGLVPWMMCYFFRILHEPKKTDAFKLAIIFFFQVTAGNPSFLIVLIYFFVIVAAVYIIQQLRKRSVDLVKRILVMFAIAGLTSIVLCLPVILNAVLIFKDSTRANGLAVEWAGMENSPLPGLFSFFTGLSGFENQVDLAVKQPLISYYIGLLSLFVAAIGFIKFRSFWLNCLGVFAVISFLISMGLESPVFALLHKWLSFFNVFRMPKLAFLYDVIYLLVLFACGYCYLKEKEISTRKIIMGIVVLFVFTCLSVVFFTYMYPQEQVPARDFTSVQDLFFTTTHAQKTMISAGIGLILLGLFYSISKTKKFVTLLSVIILADMFCFYNTTALSRIFSETSLAWKESYMDNLPRQFPVPENTSPQQAQLMARVLQPCWMNSNIYIKQPEYSNNNSFALRNYAFLEEQHPGEFNYLIRQPEAFFVNSISQGFNDKNIPSGPTAVLPANEFNRFSSALLKTEPGDSIRCTLFQPQKMMYEVSNKHLAGFLVQQNYNRFWKIRVNGNTVTPVTAYYTFPLLFLAPGKNTVEFTYEVPYFGFFFLLSIGVFLVLLVYIIWKQAQYRKTLVLLTLLLTGYCGVSFLLGQNNLKAATSTPAPLSEKYPGSYQVLNTSEPGTGNQNNYNARYNFLDPEEVSRFIESLASIPNDHITFTSYKAYFPPELEIMIENLYGECAGSTNEAACFTRTFQRKKHLPAPVYDQALKTPAELKKGQEFGEALKLKVNAQNLEMYDLLVAEADIEADHTDFTGLCMSIDNSGVTKKFIANVPLKRSTGNKRKLCLMYTLLTTTKPLDEIKFFVWNANEQPVFVKSLRVRVFRK